MNQTSRLTALLALLEERAAWSVAELADRFTVSDETIRRDIRQLETTGRAQKVHGGMCRPDHLLEGPHRLRMRDQLQAKQAIAQAALCFVERGMTLLIDSGTTSFWFARALAPIPDLTIVTNSIEIAHELIGRSGQRVFLAGGAVDQNYSATFGPEAIAYGRSFVPDLTVFSMAAIDASLGFLDIDPAEAAYKRALLDQARRIIVLADATKMLRTANYRVAQFSDVDDLVTDLRPPPAVLAAAVIGRMHIHVA